MDIRKWFSIVEKANNGSAIKSVFPEMNESINITTHRIYTDGSSINNGKKNCKGGIGVFFGDNDPRNISKHLETNKVSNNVAELMAGKLGIIKLKETNYKIGDKIIICTDSEYMINCITKWSNDWEKNGWKRNDLGKLKNIQNLELIKELRNLVRKNNVSFKHIKAHQVEPTHKNSVQYQEWYGNMMADKLANLGSNII